jgi:hypothetical protein
MADASFNLRAVRGIAHRHAQRGTPRRDAAGATIPRGRPRLNVIETTKFAI